MSIITALHAREILDSKADPVVEVEIELSSGHKALASNPSGASTGDAESLDLRDGDVSWYQGRGVQKAVSNVNSIIANSVIGHDFSTLSDLDHELLTLDSSPNKSFLGANALLPVSMAFARAQADSQNQKLYQYFGRTGFFLPLPMMLMLEGGKHGDWATDIQEFMVLPKPGAFPSFSSILQAGVKIFHTLGTILKGKHFATGVGFEGAYCPQELESNEQAFDLLTQAITDAGFAPSDQFIIAADLAASEYFQEGSYILKSEAQKSYSSIEWTEKIKYWVQKYPIFSIEDPFDQNQWGDFANLTSQVGSDHQIVGDDLVCTNTSKIQQAIDKGACNSVIIKPNQIGTVSETIAAIDLAQKAGFTTIVSHRAGETTDNFIADLAVGMNCPQCKFGGINRGERISKYNRLLAIESSLT